MKFLTDDVWQSYPEEQVEEEQHVFNAADATTSHDGVETGTAINNKG